MWEECVLRISFRRLGALIAAPAALAGAVALFAPGPAASAATSGLTRTEHVTMPADGPNGKQIYWDLAQLGSGYLAMLSELDVTAEQTAGARLVNAPGVSHPVFILDNTQTNRFADIVVTDSHDNSPGYALHVVVRLSDMYVVRFYHVNSASNVVYNLAPNLPGSASTDNNHFIGSEGYDALSRIAGTRLQDVPISYNSLTGDRYSLMQTAFTQSYQQAAGQMLRWIFAVAEGVRFPQIATRIADALNAYASTGLTDNQIALIRSWSRISEVFAGRVNGTDPSASTTIQTTSGPVTFNSIASSGRVLHTCLNTGSNPNPHDEL